MLIFILIDSKLFLRFFSLAHGLFGSFCLYSDTIILFLDIISPPPIRALNVFITVPLHPLSGILTYVSYETCYLASWDCNKALEGILWPHGLSSTELCLLKAVLSPNNTTKTKIFRPLENLPNQNYSILLLAQKGLCPSLKLHSACFEDLPVPALL